MRNNKKDINISLTRNAIVHLEPKLIKFECCINSSIDLRWSHVN